MISSKKSVLLVQVNFQYGNNVFVPYAVGSLIAYAQSIEVIGRNFFFENPLYLREDIEKVVQKIKEPYLVGFSCYIWNWEYNKLLARKIKEKFPETFIVFGGTHVPDNSFGFFEEHPYVDILVHQEGEVAFSEILIALLQGKPDLKGVAGLSIKMEDFSTFKTEKSNRIRDLSALPSPYLNGVFDYLLGSGFTLNATQETNRGCPYQCTFCDWGGSTYSKVVPIPEERIIQEFEWFGKNKVEYLFNGDANYGIWPRDLDLTRSMIDIRAKNNGYPISFRMCTAKKSNDRIFDITKLLDSAGMNKGATLSFQSMDETTLKIVKRSNIKIEAFSDFMDRYKAASIATYTELIMGMPGETYTSSKEGIDILLNAQANTVNLYVHACTVLPNSEMGQMEYMETNGIRTARMPILLAHSTPLERELDVPEFHNVIIETRSMSHDEWLKTYMFYWAIQMFHCLGLTKQISIFFNRDCSCKYSEFYELILDFFSEKEESLIGGEIKKVRSVLASAVRGGRLDMLDERFGNIYWPLEEISFLNFITEKERFFQEVKLFLKELIKKNNFKVSDSVADDLIHYQSFLMKSPDFVLDRITLKYDWHSYFSLKSSDVLTASKQISFAVVGCKHFHGDIKLYAREVVWYGRRGGSFHNIISAC